MPKRTNSFQRLATIIHSRLGSDWIVSESILLSDSITGELREIDIVAKAVVGGHDIYLSVECRDHKRPSDVTWVESMAKKHENLPTSKLVLWSRSGFTKAAITKATALKIDTVSQATASTADWAHLARDLLGGFIQLITPRLTPFIDVTGLDGTPLRLENVVTACIYDSSGQQVNSVPSIIQFILSSTEIGKVLLDHAPVGSGDFYAEMQPPAPWFTDNCDGHRLPIRRVGISISTFTEKLPLDILRSTYAPEIAAGRYGATRNDTSS